MRESEESWVVHVRSDGELLGYVAVDTTVGFRSTGGLRMAPGVTEEEVRDLARSMTLKFGILGLPQGGAKACVLGDPEAPAGERSARLDAFGRAIAPLLASRAYQPDVDMGTREEDVVRVLRAARLTPGRRRLRAPRSGGDTARTVYASIRAALQHRGEELVGRSVAIEGFGSVGSALAGMLAREGARIVAVSTSRGAVFDERGLGIDDLREKARRRGSAFVDDAPGERIEADLLLELPVDVLCPCARWRAIDVRNADRVRARVVASGANAPITPDAERALAVRGVTVVPDFVGNCGGVLGGTMAFARVPEETIRHALTTRWAAWVASLLAESDRVGAVPRDVAEPYALARHAAARSEAGRRALRGRLFDAGLALHQRGWIPPGLVGRLAERWFEVRTEPPW